MDAAGRAVYGSDTSALIQSGTVTLSNARPNDITITLSAPTAATQPDLVLDNAALGSGVYLTLVPPDVVTSVPGTGFAIITVDGYDTVEGRISLGGSKTPPDTLTIAIAPYGQLNQEGTISVLDGSKLQVSGTGDAPATLNNDGAIDIAGGNAVITADVIGSGTMAIQTVLFNNSSLELGGAVAATQHVAFDFVPSIATESLRLDNPAAFRGTIDGFSFSNDSVTLANTQATSAYFAQVTPDSGALLLLNGQSVAAALTVTGAHASNAYALSGNADGSTTIQLAPVLPSI